MFISFKFFYVLQEQQETIDSIENNLESAQVNVEEGVTLLGKVIYFMQNRELLYLSSSPSPSKKVDLIARGVMIMSSVPSPKEDCLVWTSHPSGNSTVPPWGGCAFS